MPRRPEVTRSEAGTENPRFRRRAHPAAEGREGHPLAACARRRHESGARCVCADHPDADGRAGADLN